jgi:hypothetical protein
MPHSAAAASSAAAERAGQRRPGGDAAAQGDGDARQDDRDGPAALPGGDHPRREAGQHPLQHRAAGQAAQDGGDRDRGQRRGDRERADQKPGACLGHMQRAAHLRQQPGREQVGHHVGEGRRGQGQQAPPGERVGKHPTMLKPSH